MLLAPLVENALVEDLGRRGDVTSQATIPADKQATLTLTVRDEGVMCGLVEIGLRTSRSAVRFCSLPDGAWVTAEPNSGHH